MHSLRNKDKQYYTCPGVKPAHTITAGQLPGGSLLEREVPPGQAVEQPEPVITKWALAPLLSTARLRKGRADTLISSYTVWLAGSCQMKKPFSFWRR